MPSPDLNQTQVNVRAVIDYDPAWPELFAAPGRELRAALGSAAMRIDHVGSTAVPDLAAKPIIDAQISVASFEPLNAFRDPIESCGFVWRPKNEEMTRRYFRERPGRRRTHVHVRRAGSFCEQLNLLHRDHLRAIRSARASTPPSSARSRISCSRTGMPTSTPKRRSSGTPSLAPTTGPSEPAGSPVPPMRDPARMSFNPDWEQEAENWIAWARHGTTSTGSTATPSSSCCRRPGHLRRWLPRGPASRATSPGAATASPASTHLPRCLPLRRRPMPTARTSLPTRPTSPSGTARSISSSPATR
jgi:GrpB-like predicted nucleotidyltransferase (UPF0157 family)